jgi:hypothetical protein
MTEWSDDEKIIRAGLNEPQLSTFARAPHSIRRTSHLDMAPSEPGPWPGRHITGKCRDLLTGASHGHVSTRSASITAQVTAARELLAITSDPARELDSLLHRPATQGFRAAIESLLPQEAAHNTALFALLDDLPVASLIAGYADLYSDQPKMRERSTEGRGPKADICAGWRSDGTMMVALRKNGSIPVPLGPDDVQLVSSADPVSWHEIGPLVASSMRRRRLLDIAYQRESDGSTLLVQAMFRDTHANDQAVETVVHEYSLVAIVDSASYEVRSCVATPHVLPWDECPAAAASAGGLVGHSLLDVRALVGKEFRGTSICTHLNDLLRSLGSVPTLRKALDAGSVD